MGNDNPFKVAGVPDSVGGLGQPVIEAEPSGGPERRLRSMIGSADVFLLIKGTPQRPMCGFSANTVAVMEALGVPFRTFDVLSDEPVREAAKKVAAWPTFPQVWVRGEFVGGNDIVTEMYQAGELQALVAGART